MTKNDLQFQISQLRQDKVIYAVESVAVTAAALMTIFILSAFGPMLGPVYTIDGLEYPLIPLIIGVAAIFYWVYVMLGNLFRLKKIQKLESELKNYDQR